MSNGTLYSFAESGNSYKVRLLAAVLGIDLKIEELDFLVSYLVYFLSMLHSRSSKNDQQHSPEFLRINPRGEVPVLVDGDKTFSDSSSILVWLAGKYSQDGKTPGPSSFWSNDLYEQAQIVDWVIISHITVDAMLILVAARIRK